MTDTGTVEKSLFIPLCKKWFKLFQSGEKTVEYRAYGPRWNERTCVPGRDAVLANGYGWPRLFGRVESLTVLPRAEAPEVAREIFPNADRIAAISITFAPPSPRLKEINQ